MFSAEGGDQQCCYGPTGELLPYAKGGGSVSRFSATHQPLLYMLRDFWPRIMCDQLANKPSAYQQLRPTDDCSGYVPPEQGILTYEIKTVCNMLFNTLYIQVGICIYNIRSKELLTKAVCLISVIVTITIVSTTYFPIVNPRRT